MGPMVVGTHLMEVGPNMDSNNVLRIILLQEEVVRSLVAVGNNEEDDGTTLQE